MSMEKRDVFFISVLYIAAYSIMLIVKGYFWDDWTFFNINEKIAIDQFFENGNIWFGYYIKFLFYIEAHYFPARLFTFFAYLFSTILLYGILRNINLFDSTSRFFIVAEGLFSLPGGQRGRGSLEGKGSKRRITQSLF